MVALLTFTSVVISSLHTLSNSHRVSDLDAVFKPDRQKLEQWFPAWGVKCVTSVFRLFSNFLLLSHEIVSPLLAFENDARRLV